jgi:hypothetical protein
MNRSLSITLAICLSASAMTLAQESKDKALDITSSVGDLHVGGDADAKKVGLPLYPGAQAKTDDDNNSPANLSLFTDAFGMKLVVAHYVSNDDQGKVIDFYRSKMRKYGRVLECHSHDEGGKLDVHSDSKDSKSKELKCDDDSGPVTELKVGTEDHQRIVAIQPNEKGTGAKFSLIYLYTRGKQADI